MCGLNKITKLPFCLTENPLWVYTAPQGGCPPQAGFVPPVASISRPHPGNSAFHDCCGKGREAQRINTCSSMLHPGRDTHFLSQNWSHGYLTSRGWKNVSTLYPQGGEYWLLVSMPCHSKWSPLQEEYTICFLKSFLVKVGSKGHRGTVSFQGTEPERWLGKSRGHQSGSHMGGLTSLTSGFSFAKWRSSFLPRAVVKTVI